MTENILGNPGDQGLESVSADGAFSVQLVSSGKTYLIAPDKSVLQVLIENDISVPFSCEQGICGTCVTGVLAGRPDHRDMYLSEEEQAANNEFTPCCSRAKTRLLVLDL